MAHDVNPPAPTAPCAPQACAACPWRKSNQGKPHPHGWYRQENLRRLWTGLRTAAAPGMSCHPTDSRNDVPEGVKPVPETATMHECAGSLVLIQRELRRLVAAPKLYPKRAPHLSRDGIQWWAVARGMFGGQPVVGGPVMPDLTDDPEIYYAPLAQAHAESLARRPDLP